jgi:hypothetical protein
MPAKEAVLVRLPAVGPTVEALRLEGYFYRIILFLVLP